MLQTQKSFDNNKTKKIGNLVLVPTPIGNLDDMTMRSINALKTADLIAAEDTRNTKKLLNHFDISTKQISFHEHNKEEKIPLLIDKLKAGIEIAQVSDAGMPSISDPGSELVQAAIKEGISVIPLPGANAALTGLIASGISPQPFLFYGFLKRKSKEKVEELEHLKNESASLIFYEAPHRLKKTLNSMQKVFGSNRQVVLSRELTKRFEEFIRGNFEEVTKWAQDNPIRGEFVIFVACNNQPISNSKKDDLEGLTLDQQVTHLINKGQKTNDAIKLVAKKHNLKKQEVYNIYHHL